jgi:hypothetical protein
MEMGGPSFSGVRSAQSRALIGYGYGKPRTFAPGYRVAAPLALRMPEGRLRKLAGGYARRFDNASLMAIPSGITEGFRAPSSASCIYLKRTNRTRFFLFSVANGDAISDRRRRCLFAPPRTTPDPASHDWAVAAY